MIIYACPTYKMHEDYCTVTVFESVFSVYSCRLYLSILWTHVVLLWYNFLVLVVLSNT